MGRKTLTRTRMSPSALHFYAREFLEAADALAPPPPEVGS
jgi:hypothetical protein